MLFMVIYFATMWELLRSNFGYNWDDNLSNFVRLYIRSFRNSIGDILTPIYGPKAIKVAET